MEGLRDAIEAAVVESNPEPAAPAPVETSAPTVESTPTPVASGSTTTEVTGAPEPVEASGSDKPRDITEVVEDPKPTEKVEKTDKPLDNRIDRAPTSWKGDAKKLWAELPLQARQEIIRRERDAAKVMQEAADYRKKVDAVHNAIAPHMDRIKSTYNGNPVAALESLLNVEKTLVSGTAGTKAELVAHIIKQFDIDIGTLDSLLAGQAPAPEVQQLSQVEQLLNQRLQPMMTFLERQQQMERQQLQQIEQQAVMTVEQMAQDPDYPYFSEVRNDMADLIEIFAKKGVSLSLQEAYNKAVRINDGTFQAANIRSSTQSATQAALNAHQQAQKAKGAAVSVSGSPTGIGQSAGNPSDLRGTIAGALDSLGSRI